MKNITLAAILTIILILALSGCADKSPSLDYKDYETGEILDAECTLAQLQKGLKKEFKKDVLYAEGEILKASSFRFHLERNGDRLTVVKTIGDGNFLSLLSFGYMEKVKTPTGMELNDFVKDDNGDFILNTKLVIDYYHHVVK